MGRRAYNKCPNQDCLMRKMGGFNLKISCVLHPASVREWKPIVNIFHMSQHWNEILISPSSYPYRSVKAQINCHQINKKIKVLQRNAKKWHIYCFIPCMKFIQSLLLKLSCFKKVFRLLPLVTYHRLWPLLTSNRLWQKQITIRFSLCCISHIQYLCTKLNHHVLFEFM